MSISPDLRPAILTEINNLLRDPLTEAHRKALHYFYGRITKSLEKHGESDGKKTNQKVP